MPKAKVLLAVLLVILGALLIGIFLWPAGGGEQKYSVVQRESLLRTANGWTVQFDIVNHEGVDKNYTVNLAVDGKPSTITASVRSGGVFTYIKDVSRNEVTEGELSFTIYGEGETCIKDATYHLY